MTPTGYDAVVLAGGRSTRMGGRDKTRLVVGDRALLDRVVDATADAGRVVVVGPRRRTARPVTWTRERPPGGGPAAGVRAGLDLVTAPLVVLLAADLPFVTAAHVRAVVSAVVDDGAVLTDPEGREQWLCSAWRAAALSGAPLVPGGSLHAALSPLRFAAVPEAAVADAAGGWLDCDTPEQLRRAREMA